MLAHSRPETMILEGIMTTLDGDGHVNIAPMGPIVDEAMRQLLLRPYQSSTTYANLRRSGQGVFHVTDDVELLARAAIDQLETQPPLRDAEAVEGRILADACRWYAIRVRSIDDSRPRTEIIADVVAHGRVRDFFGFNRAKHAVIEAAILATRIELLPIEHVVEEFDRLTSAVEKTGGPAEHRAFQLLRSYVQRALPSGGELDLTS